MSSNSRITESQVNSAFKLDFKSGTVPANSEIDLGITFAPLEIANFDLKLVVQVK